MFGCCNHSLCCILTGLIYDVINVIQNKGILTTGKKNNITITNGERSLPKEATMKMLEDEKRYKDEDQGYRRKHAAH